LLDLTGCWDKAERLYRANLDKLLAAGQDCLIAESQSRLAMLLCSRGHYRDAEALLLEAASRNDGVKNLKGLALIMGNLGGVYRLQGNYPKALEHHRKQLEIFEELGDEEGISDALGDQGIVHWERGELEQALACYRQQEDACRRIGDRLGMARVLNNRGIIFNLLGKYDQAAADFKASSGIFRELGDKSGLSNPEGNLGVTYAMTGERRKALKCYESQARIARELGHRYNLAMAWGNTAEIYRDQGEWEKARKYYDQAVVISRETEAKSQLCELLLSCAELHRRTGELKVCRSMAAEGRQLALALGNADLIFTVSLLEAVIREDAVRSVDDLNSLLAGTSKQNEQAIVHYELYKKTGQRDDAARSLELYRKLYEGNPLALFRERADELETALS